MRNVISLFFVLFFTLCSYAQTTFSGVVKDSDGQPVPSASVTVEEVGKDAIMAYSISNSKGEYKVTFTTSESNVDLKIKAFNHKPFSKTVSNQTQNLNFSLEDDATEIKEVKLKTKLITKRGDTITYDLKAFESKSDRTLADVLKKIPGIEVNKDGTILYQGEAINKFYVNGKDLMEGGYGTVNNSLPTDAVQKVEVMENHQPVKILQDKVPAENAALNVVLKKSVTMTGRGEIGAGFSPLLWNVKLTPMFFGQKNQWVVNYKANNNGESVEKEGNLLGFGSRWEGRRGQASQNSWLNVEKADVPDIPEKRYLLNNVHFVSANLLTNPFKNKEWELKANANYTNNTVKRESYNLVNDYQNNTSYFTNMVNRFYTDKAKGELIFTKNAKKGFFKNTTTFTQFWNADRANVDRSGTFSNQGTESPTSSFQNSLSTIVPWKEKLINVMSYINYQNDAQSLEISPLSSFIGTAVPVLAGSSAVTQNFNLKTLEVSHSVNVGFNKKSWTIIPEMGYNYTSNHLETSLFGNNGVFAGSNFENNLDYVYSQPYVSMNVNYKKDALQFFAQFPMNSNSILAKDLDRNVNKTLDKVTFEPSFFGNYSFASFFKAVLSGNINYNFGDVNNMYAGLVLSNPARISAIGADNPILQNKMTMVGERIEYRNPLNNLFFNFGHRYSKNKRNLISNPYRDGLGYVTTNFIELDNRTLTNTFYAEAGKYFPKFKSNMSVNYNNATSKSQILQNGDLIDTKMNGQNVGFKFNNTYFSWMSLDYNLTYGWNKQRNSINPNESSSFQHNLALYLYPLENHTIGFFWDQLNSGNNDQTYKNAFYDLSYQYTWAKKKIDFEVKWLNIANTKTFERFNVSETYDEYTRINIRPSQVMFTVKFNFK